MYYICRLIYSIGRLIIFNGSSHSNGSKFFPISCPVLLSLFSPSLLSFFPLPSTNPSNPISPHYRPKTLHIHLYTSIDTYMTIYTPHRRKGEGVCGVEKREDLPSIYCPSDSLSLISAVDDLTPPLLSFKNTFHIDTHILEIIANMDLNKELDEILSYGLTSPTMKQKEKRSTGEEERQMRGYTTPEGRTSLSLSLTTPTTPLTKMVDRDVRRDIGEEHAGDSDSASLTSEESAGSTSFASFSSCDMTAHILGSKKKKKTPRNRYFFQTNRTSSNTSVLADGEIKERSSLEEREREKQNKKDSENVNGRKMNHSSSSSSLSTSQPLSSCTVFVEVFTEGENVSNCIESSLRKLGAKVCKRWSNKENLTHIVWKDGRKNIARKYHLYQKGAITVNPLWVNM